MSQPTINPEYQKSFESVKRVVLHYLEICYSCRNSDQHMVNHIWKKYPEINFETLRRTRQKIQNDEKLFVPDRKTQNARQAKELYMRDNISNL